MVEMIVRAVRVLLPEHPSGKLDIPEGILFRGFRIFLRSLTWRSTGLFPALSDVFSVDM